MLKSKDLDPSVSETAAAVFMSCVLSLSVDSCGLCYSVLPPNHDRRSRGYVAVKFSQKRCTSVDKVAQNWPRLVLKGPNGPTVCRSLVSRELFTFLNRDSASLSLVPSTPAIQL